MVTSNFQDGGVESQRGATARLARYTRCLEVHLWQDTLKYTDTTAVQTLSKLPTSNSSDLEPCMQSTNLCLEKRANFMKKMGVSSLDGPCVALANGVRS